MALNGGSCRESDDKIPAFGINASGSSGLTEQLSAAPEFWHALSKQPDRQASFKEVPDSRPRRCCDFLSRSMQRSSPSMPFEQTLVILRHSERLDHLDPAGYASSEEGKRRPHDSPLTEHGFALSRKVAGEIEKLHEAANFLCIACSPYRRCLETASALVERLDIPVIIDQEIGEVWDEKMPKEAPGHRTCDEISEIVDGLGMTILNPMEGDGMKFMGRPPKVWPETMQLAHERYLVRMADYIDHSVQNRHNAIIVTHAPAVVAALDVFEHGHIKISGIDYCARVVATRTVATPEKSNTDDAEAYTEQWRVEFDGLDAEEVESDPEIEVEFEENCHKIAEAYHTRKACRSYTDEQFDRVLGETIQRHSFQTSGDSTGSLTLTPTTIGEGVRQGRQAPSRAPKPKVSTKPAPRTLKDSRC